MTLEDHLIIKLINKHMPKVIVAGKVKKFPYTKKGVAAAKKATKSAKKSKK